MAGQGAKSRIRARKAKAKQTAKKVARQTDNFLASLPKISEDDLLDFQFKHFGDDSRPANWFVDAETALNCGFEEDDLGYYDDGTKRTLTHEQVAIFRRTELWQLEREQLRQKEADAEAAEAAEAKEMETVQEPAQLQTSDDPAYRDEQLSRPAASRKKQDRRKQDPLISATANRPWQKRRLDLADSNESWKQRRYQQIVPYDQRHKRNWENYVEEVDPVEGSLTHRRKARELDNQQQESVEMDY